MTLDGLLLPAGVACLGVPTALVCGRRMRETLNRPIRRQNDGLLSLVRSPLNWVDLARAAAGTWLVQQALQGAIGSGDELAVTFLAVELGIFFAGVSAQTLWLRKPIRVIGPIFFLSGMTLVMSGLAGVFALVTAFACALMFKRVSAVFVLMPVGLLGFGYLFRELTIPIAFNAVVFGLPPLLSFRFGTRMSFLRKSTGLRGYVPAPVPPAVAASPLREEEPEPEVAPVLRPNFVHPAVVAAEPEHLDPPMRKEPMASPPPSPPKDLPDFLRLADDEPEPLPGKRKRRLFARKGA